MRLYSPGHRLPSPVSTAPLQKIAVTAAKFEQYDVAMKLISGVIVSTSANTRMKDRARAFKEQIMKQIKMKNAAGSEG